MENKEAEKLNREALENVSGGFEGTLSKTGACPQCGNQNKQLCYASRGEGIQYKCLDCGIYFFCLDD